MSSSKKFPHVNRNLLESIFGNYLRDHEGFIECRIIKKDSVPTQRFYQSLNDVFSDASLDDLGIMNQQGWNIFFSVCPRVREHGKKEDVAHATTLWADLDAKDYSGGKEEAWERLMKFEIAPSAITDSGHGYHAYWLLSEIVDVTNPKQFEGCVKGIARKLGSDSVHDVSRVLRLPGFINVKEPSNPVPCVLLEDSFFPERQYTLQDFMHLWVQSEEKSRVVALSNVPKEVPPRFLALLKTDAKLAATWNGTRKLPNDNSRSGYDMSLAQQLKQHGFTDEETASILIQSPSGKGKDASPLYLAHTIGKTESRLAEPVSEWNPLEALELIPKETPKYKLPDVLDEFFHRLAGESPAKIGSMLRHAIKDRFGLTLGDIAAYEKTVMVYKKQHDALAKGVGVVSGGINWAEALQGGLTDGKNYELDLIINGVPLHLDGMSDTTMEDPQYIARRCRHILKDTSIFCPYPKDQEGTIAWIKNVLSVWLPKITGDTASNSLELGMAWLRKYCDTSISKRSHPKPFQQMEHAVKDGPIFYVPYPGFYAFIKKKNDKATADKCAQVVLESVGAIKRKGGVRTNFYEINEHDLYGEGSLPLETGIGQDNVSSGTHAEDEVGGEVDPSVELWKEERRRSEE